MDDIYDLIQLLKLTSVTSHLLGDQVILIGEAKFNRALNNESILL